MLRTKPERMTYAQEKLIKLIEERKLRSWCMNNGLTHSAIYRLALGEHPPTYRTIASMCHLISPIEWLFFNDEKLPYEPVLLPKWDCSKPSKYISEHRYDYKTIAMKYNLDETSAYNIFVSYRANPTPAFIKQLCPEINPADFFTEGNTELKPKSLKEFVPDRGDIVNVDGIILFILTKLNDNESHKYFTGCVIQPNFENGILLENTVTKGFVNFYNIKSFPITQTCPRILIEKTTADFTSKVLEAVKSSLL